jgi:predicted nucleotidyltransferase
MKREALLARVRAELEQAFGPRFKGVVLFGSEARGRSTPGSDVDLLVLLDGAVELVWDMRKAVRAVLPIGLEIDRVIHPIPVSLETFETSGSPFYAVVRREGIVAR